MNTVYISISMLTVNKAKENSIRLELKRLNNTICKTTKNNNVQEDFFMLFIDKLYIIITFEKEINV